MSESNFIKSQSTKILLSYIDAENILSKGRKPALLGEVRKFGDRFFEKRMDGWVEVTKQSSTNKKIDTEFSAQDEKIIGDYTGILYSALNSRLREGGGKILKEHETKSANQDVVDSLVNALDKLPNYGKKSYRWENSWKDIKDHVNDFNPGELIIKHSFTSTSKSETPPDTIGGGDISYEIDGKFGKDITNFSNEEAENEILFKPNSIFMVVDREIKYFKHKSGLSIIAGIHVKLKEL